MNPQNFYEFILTGIHLVTGNTKSFKFTLAPEQEVKTLQAFPVACCVRIEYKGVVRPYTPVEQEGNSIRFYIKCYPKGEMSQKLHSMLIGDRVKIQGPLPKIAYAANKWKKIGMIAGGTGITPMWQVILQATQEPSDRTEITLLYGSKAEEDIILRSEIEKLAEAHSNFKYHFVLSNPNKAWDGLTGRIGLDLISEYLPGPKEGDSIIFICGPDPMDNALAGPKGPNYTQGPLGGVLKTAGYNEDNVFKY
eukprot:Gregarina_sp_Poly_1__10691@NODE_80_length_15637_cov_125_963134_g68_i0_p9_GENE_NODE_80_length_15637_cov_125_963134_g68_i0NODE_80_length_15637_cov_125_963134_g68_i0_p9_ORF_typecomplete_len250_score28_90NAD_binding_1/PF00175_21/6_7e28FAD_binding_6/PF00970_24/3_9e16FAD_binding_6/PF00970_24/1_1e04NAD_binding_6/PF08030_12/3_8e05RsgA_N/PF16745_5/0_039_NODE_80_length_15637_cov_125_963134_g68_i014012150